MKTTLLVIIALLLALTPLKAQNKPDRWNNLVLKGYVATRDTIPVDIANSKEIIKPLEGAAVLLFSSLNKAQDFKNKFEGMGNLLDTIKTYRDSANTIWHGHSNFFEIKAKFRSFLAMSKNSASATKMNLAIDSIESKLVKQDSSFYPAWKQLFKQVSSISRQDFQQISSTNKFGTETDSEGKFYILTSEQDKAELKYVLVGLMGYHFTLNEITPALPDTLFLTEKIFSLQKVEVTVEADAPYKPVYFSRNFSYTSKIPDKDDFDPTPYLLVKSIPVDLSIGFGDYTWYYTYNSGVYIGRKTAQFYRFLFGKPAAQEAAPEKAKAE